MAAYGSGGWPAYRMEDLVEEAQRYAEAGLRYYKLKVHHPDPRENRRRVEAVRRALGDGVRLMVDVNQKLDVLGNLRLAAALEDLDLVWYEEPVLADDIAACAEVARAIRIPVATGENHYTRFEFRELCERRAARYLMPDVCRANGFSETLKIGHLAAAHQLLVSPHVVHELSVHVAGALSNGFLVEYMDWMPPDLFVDMPRPDPADGLIRIPDRPGHGMALAPGRRAEVPPPLSGAVAEGGESARHRTVRWDDPAPSAEAAGRLAGLPFLEAIRDGRLPAAPVSQLVGFALTEVEPGARSSSASRPNRSTTRSARCTAASSARCSIRRSRARSTRRCPPAPATRRPSSR